ncbi:hypothetical protein P7C73_g4908, partial [Tremellales sp. Uapishka_1]
MTNHSRPPLPASGPYYNLGTFQRPITTTSPDAQVWFNRGLVWIYSFHHEEAITCFENALKNDPSCVMAYWGIAYCPGTNYNNPWNLFSKPDVEKNMRMIHTNLDSGSKYLHLSTPIERRLMKALDSRYPRNYGDYDVGRWNLDYCRVMKEVFDHHADDLDVLALYVDSLMCLTPWKLWDLKTGKPAPNSRAFEIQAILEGILVTGKADRHPGILHFYIHLMEMSTNPEKAVPASDRLYELIPDAAHLNHMPSHLDIAIGDYRRAIASNLTAIVSDEKYERQHGYSNFYTVYRLHNYHTLIYAAMFNGQYEIANRYAIKMEESMPEDLVRSQPDFIEAGYSIRIHVFVRFGRWKEILATAFPKDKELYSTTTAMLHYARGIAYAATGDVEAGERELEHLLEAITRIQPSRNLYPNHATAIIQIGVEMLRGEIEYRKSNFGPAFEHLRRSIELYDGLTYAEPWGWMQPVRHAYAALQLEQGNLEEALKTYAADLGYDDSLARACQHPNNVWALHGYHECLVRLGRVDEAKIIKPQLRLALAVADVKVQSSCFCRLEVSEGALPEGGKCCVVEEGT